MISPNVLKLNRRDLQFTGYVAVFLVATALIVLTQNYVKHAANADYSVGLSLVYNLIVFGSYALLTPIILKLTALFPLRKHWVNGLMIHLLLSVALALLHMLLCNLVLYAIDLSSSPIFPRFIKKYLTNVVHFHLLIYWAVVLVTRFYQKRESRPQVQPETAEQLEQFVIKSNGNALILTPGEVLWIEALDHYQKLHTAEGYHIIKDSMKHLEQVLPDQFKRAHRSYFVNMDYVKSKSYDKSSRASFLELQNGKRLRLGKAYSKTF